MKQDLAPVNSSKNLDHERQIELSDRAKKFFIESVDTRAADKAYKSDFRVFEAWMHQTKCSSPPNVGDIVNFLVDQFTGHLSRYNKATGALELGGQLSINTVSRRKSAIVKILEQRGINLGPHSKTVLKETIERMRNNSEQDAPERKRGAAAALRRQEVAKLLICPAIKKASEFVRLRDRALLSLMASSGARQSEIMGEFGIRLRDITVTDDRIEFKRMRLKRKSRTRNWTGSIPYKASQLSAYNNVARYVRFVEKLEGITPDHNLFIAANRKGEPQRSLRAYGAQNFRKLLVDYALSAKLPLEIIKDLKGHSTRTGLVNGALEDGVSVENVARITGQTIATVERYAEQRKAFEYDGTAT